MILVNQKMAITGPLVLGIYVLFLILILILPAPPGEPCHQLCNWQITAVILRARVEIRIDVPGQELLENLSFLISAAVGRLHHGMQEVEQSARSENSVSL